MRTGRDHSRGLAHQICQRAPEAALLHLEVEAWKPGPTWHQDSCGAIRPLLAPNSRVLWFCRPAGRQHASAWHQSRQRKAQKKDSHENLVMAEHFDFLRAENCLMFQPQPSCPQQMWSPLQTGSLQQRPHGTGAAHWPRQCSHASTCLSPTGMSSIYHSILPWRHG